MRLKDAVATVDVLLNNAGALGTETDMLRALIGPQNASFQAKPPDVVAGLIKVIDGLTLENSSAPTYSTAACCRGEHLTTITTALV